MFFNSLSFLIYLVVVFVIYWALPNKLRCIFLLIASYYFYLFQNVTYAIPLLFVTLFSFVSALIVGTEKEESKRKGIFIFGIFFILVILIYFKYFNFFCSSAAFGLYRLGFSVRSFTVKVALPIGISFYVFQSLSYLIDVYRKKVPAEKNLMFYATYLVFFPQLVAGPIERTEKLLSQIKQEHKFDYDCATYGLKQMLWGFFKKVAIADNIASITKKIFEYSSVGDLEGSVFLFAAMLYSIQIYCDFSGYSDIAIGVAKLFGFNLSVNFKCPYFSQSIREFWNRWHITLSVWFRDYLYIPLGGNRKGKIREYLNILIVFVLCGLWHGASWNFVWWGGIYGLILVIEHFLFPEKLERKGGLVGFLRVIYVWIVSSLLWIVFANDTDYALSHIFNHMFVGISDFGKYLEYGYRLLDIGDIARFSLLLNITILFVYDYFSMKNDVIKFVSTRNVFLRWSIYIVFSLWVIMNVPFIEPSNFIYFRF